MSFLMMVIGAGLLLLVSAIVIRLYFREKRRHLGALVSYDSEKEN